jgi:hypothetical protein
VIWVFHVKRSKPEVTYDCRFHVNTKKISEDNTYTLFQSDCSIVYEDETWEESRRELAMEAEYKVAKKDNTIVNNKLCKFRLKST